MSLRLTVEAWELLIDPMEKFVLIAIADAAGGGEEELWPIDVDKLVVKTCLTEEQVRSILSGMFSRGVLIPAEDPLNTGEDQYFHVSFDMLPHLRSKEELWPTTHEQPATVESTSQGYVYLLYGAGYYKIGQTRNIGSRSRSFETQFPFEVSLAHVIETNKPLALERQLHEKFKDKRVRGEWFELLPEDVQYVKSLGHTWEGFDK
jgi:hypothetical protein